MGNDHSTVTPDCEPIAMVHTPYSFPVGSAPPPSREGHEELLCQTVVRFLHDVEVNPFACSIPAQRLQQRVFGTCPELARFVVGDEGWRAFLLRHTSLFIITTSERGRMMIRSVQHVNWKEGEARQAALQVTKTGYLASWLVHRLSSLPHQTATVADLVAEYCEGDHPFPMPACGDLIRFVHKCVPAVHFDHTAKAFSLTSAIAATPHVVLRHPHPVRPAFQPLSVGPIAAASSRGSTAGRSPNTTPRGAPHQPRRGGGQPHNGPPHQGHRPSPHGPHRATWQQRDHAAALAAQPLRSAHLPHQAAPHQQRDAMWRARTQP